MKRDTFLSATVLLALLLSTGARAADVFRWVDANGVTHYSDTPPKDGEEVQSLRVNDSNPPGYDPADDPYSIVNQAKRMNEKWSALAKEKEERAAERQESTRYVVHHAPEYHDGWRYSYWPGYYAPVQPVRPMPRQLPTIRRQAGALDALKLTGPRPHSINSGAHAARVESSSTFLQTLTAPVPHPAPRHR